jgi:FKBP-type peptidyl-prolyl cis-trans isomerase FklB
MGSALIGATVILAACSGGGAASFENAALETDDQKASYAIGLNVGGQISDASERLDRMAFMRGLEDALQGSDPDIPSEELQAVLQAFGQEIQAAAAQERQRVGQENAAAGAAYQEENAAKEGVMTTESGLQYEVLREGEGATPTAENQVRLHYRGTLIDGTEFDSSYDGEPAVFNAGGLIQGFSEALMMMKEGGHWRIVIPSEIAYGPQGSGPQIGPNSTLVFEIELLEVLD